MNKLKIVALLSLLAFSLVGCCRQTLAREFGGSVTIHVRPGFKVVDAYWDQDTVDILSRPVHTGEVPETLYLDEHSALGAFQSTVIIIEQ